MELYQPQLTEKPSALVINKLDTKDADENLEIFMENFDNFKSKIFYKS